LLLKPLAMLLESSVVGAALTLTELNDDGAWQTNGGVCSPCAAGEYSDSSFLWCSRKRPKAMTLIPAQKKGECHCSVQTPSCVRQLQSRSRQQVATEVCQLQSRSRQQAATEV